jgi:hypothetical protein
MRNPDSPDTIERQPYELLAEHEAEVRISELKKQCKGDSEKIVALLPGILQEVFHEGIETGTALADRNFDAGPVDIMEAYSMGYTAGYLKRGL